MIIIKPISKKEIEKLMDKGIIRNTHKGYINKKGYHVGYYKTSGNNRYIEDYYADKAKITVKECLTITKFYDTNALLNLQEAAFKERFFISDETLREIENIKTSSRKR